MPLVDDRDETKQDASLAEWGAEPDRDPARPDPEPRREHPQNDQFADARETPAPVGDGSEQGQLVTDPENPNQTLAGDPASGRSLWHSDENE
jgi:hypothetical protein